MRSLTTLVLLLTGCSLYSRADDCSTREIAPAPLVRDSSTGKCFVDVNFCDGCVPCPPKVADPSIAGSAPCGGDCEALSEAACLDARGCHAAYRTDPRGAVSFVGCWAVAFGRPPSDASACAQLDVHSCPFRDDCATLYTGSSDAAMSFDRCETERESCEPGTCGAPSPCPSNSVNTTRNGCYTGHCIARSECPKLFCSELSTELQCTGHAECEPLFRGDDCTCSPTTCTCAKRTFESCHDAPS